MDEIEVKGQTITLNRNNAPLIAYAVQRALLDEVRSLRLNAPFCINEDAETDPYALSDAAFSVNRITEYLGFLAAYDDIVDDEINGVDLESAQQIAEVA